MVLEDFGFQHRIWVFSGRRGIHCWIGDEHARKLSPAGRKAVVSFLELKRGGSEVRKKLSLPSSVHPSLAYNHSTQKDCLILSRRSVQIVQESFPDVMLNDQDFLNHPETRETFMKMVPESKFMLASLTKVTARYEAATRGPVEERRGIAIEREMV